MTSSIIRGLLMSDGLPTEDRIVSVYLDYLALACVFGFVETLTIGRWPLSLGMLAASLIFHSAGIKWPQIKSKTATFLDWGFWGHRIVVAIRALLVLSVIALAITGYHVRRAMVLPNEIRSSLIPAPTRKAPPLDWRIKENWRQNVHTGMTRTEVRHIFSEPEKISVVSTLENWGYGSGEITFDMDGHPDGSLYSWFEPEKE
jgi:hypothetical protein